MLTTPSTKYIPKATKDEKQQQQQVIFVFTAFTIYLPKYQVPKKKDDDGNNKQGIGRGGTSHFSGRKKTQ